MKKYILTVLLLLSVGIVDAQHYVTTYTGTGSPGFSNGNLSEASFRTPFGICADKKGNIFIADNGNNCIRKISTDGQVSTYAGTGVKGFKDGSASEAQFSGPTALCLDSLGNMFVADFENHRIRKIDTFGIVTSIAGDGTAGYKNSTNPAAARFNYPRGICIDPKGNLYVGDSWNHRIRKIAVSGEVSTYAGGGDTIGVQSTGHYVNGKDTLARFYTPCEVKIDAVGNILVADAFNHRIRKIDTGRIVSTIAGSGPIGKDAGGFQDGATTDARFNTPTTVFLDIDSSIYLGDGINQRVRKIKNGIVSTFAGSGLTGFEDGVDSEASFNFPRGVVKEISSGDFLVVDYNNNSIRRISEHEPQGIISIKKMIAQVFPNPFSESVIVELGDNKNGIIECYSVQGLLLRKENISERITKMDFRNLPPGIYFLKISDDDKVCIKKIIKE